jgi:hypothetical protein
MYVCDTLLNKEKIVIKQCIKYSAQNTYHKHSEAESYLSLAKV